MSIDTQLTNDWISCARWLIKCLPDLLHPMAPMIDSCDSERTVIELFNSLKDGVVLCHLLPVLSNNQIKLSDLKQFRSVTLQSAFIFKSNLNIFLNHCKSHFSLSKKDLFDADDVLNPEKSCHFSAITKTLSVLSNCPKVRASGCSVEGFSVSKVNAQEEDEYYERVFSCEVTDVYTEEPVYTVGEFRFGGINRDEEIYETLVSISETSGNVQEKKTLTKKDHCIMEIVETEKKYVETLKILVDTKTELSKQTSFWDKNEVDKLFGNLPELLVVHTAICNQLKKSVLNTNIHDLAKPFKEMKMKLLQYAPYCATLGETQNALDTIYSTPGPKLDGLNQCLMEVTKNSNFRLFDYVTVPMQRILKYHMLIDSLMKYCKEDKESVKSLQEAHATLVDVNDYINEFKRDLEMQAVISDIESSMDELNLQEDIQLKDYGRLLCDGELKILDDPKKTKGSSKLHYCFLFDKILLICKQNPKTSRNVFQKFYFIKRTDSVDIEEVHLHDTSFIGRGGKWLHGVRITNKDSDEAVGLSDFLFLTRTKEMAIRWKEQIKQAMYTTFPSNSAYVYYSFSEPQICSFCDKLLKGAYYQGYVIKKGNENISVAHRMCVPAITRDSCYMDPIRENNNGTVDRPLPILPGTYFISTAAYNGYPLPPTKENPLKFEANASIKVLNTSQATWWSGELDGNIGMFPSSHVQSVDPLVNLRRYKWFAGDMDRESAKKTLGWYKDGTYLVRYNVAKRTFALSLRYQLQVKQIMIHISRNNSYYIIQDRHFPGIPSLIEYYQQHSLSECFNDLKTNLQFPYQESLKRRQSQQIH